jgi:hypothetical protein
MIDEKVSDMMHPSVGLNSDFRLSQLDSSLSHFVLVTRGATSDRFDSVAISISRGKIHLGIDSGRITVQCLFDETLISDKLSPIIDGQKTQTGNAIANRNLIGRLSLTFRLNQLLSRLPLIA